MLGIFGAEFLLNAAELGPVVEVPLQDNYDIRGGFSIISIASI